MNDGPNSKLSDEEARALRALGHDVDPSPELEGRIVSELKRRGSIRARGGIIMQTARVGVVAAVLAGVFVAGLVVGKRGEAQQVTQTTIADAPAQPAGNQYMLLMYTQSRGEPATERAPATEAQKAAMTAIVHEYRDWAIAREQEGRLVGADKLSDDIRLMTRAGGETAIASAPNDPRMLGGYFTITAPSLDAAVEIAKSHPHLKYGGEVEVRPIEVVQ